MTSQRLIQERQEVDRLVQQVGCLTILKSLTPLTRAIDNYSGGKGRVNECDFAPCHNSDSGKKFFLLDDADRRGVGYCRVCGKVSDLYQIIGDFNGCGFPEAYRMVRDFVGYERDGKSRPPVPQFKKPEPVNEEPSKEDLEFQAKHRQNMAKLWDEAYDIEDPRSSLGVAYMKGRGITNIPTAASSIAFHPSVNYHQSIVVPKLSVEESPKEWEEYNQLISDCQSSPYFNKFIYKDKMISGADMGNHPCLLLLLRSHDFKSRRVLKVYLNVDGQKLELPRNPAFSVKKVCFSPGEESRLSGAACYLDSPTEIMMVAEGFETVAVVRSHVPLPSASTFNSSGLGSFEFPAGVKIVFSLVDKDRSRAGCKATLKLMKRGLEQGVLVIPVIIRSEIPEGEGGLDWADVLNSPHGEDELPPYLTNPFERWDWSLIFNDFFQAYLAEEENKWK